jgi:hypothetical protein
VECLWISGESSRTDSTTHKLLFFDVVSVIFDVYSGHRNFGIGLSTMILGKKQNVRYSAFFFIL